MKKQDPAISPPFIARTLGRRIELVEKLQYTWLARICGSGKEIEVWEDEFELD